MATLSISGGGVGGGFGGGFGGGSGGDGQPPGKDGRGGPPSKANVVVPKFDETQFVDPALIALMTTGQRRQLTGLLGTVAEVAAVMDPVALTIVPGQIPAELAVRALVAVAGAEDTHGILARRATALLASFLRRLDENSTITNGAGGEMITEGGGGFEHPLATLIRQPLGEVVQRRMAQDTGIRGILARQRDRWLGDRGGGAE
ncbi:MAG: hypothetical protein M1812_000066 [Candelaria pacifica]|nr:MAG: hypothetical protein M1812_000066 [Candelaria pacifica]